MGRKGRRKEDYLRPRLRQIERQQRGGVHFILKRMLSNLEAVYRKADHSIDQVIQLLAA